MLSDSFEVDLRAALQVQADLLRRIERTTEGAARDFAESRIAPGEIGAADAALAELEAHAELLDAGDLEDFDPEEIPGSTSDAGRRYLRNWCGSATAAGTTS
jgi:hypothetical protein